MYTIYLYNQNRYLPNNTNTMTSNASNVTKIPCSYLLDPKLPVRILEIVANNPEIQQELKCSEKVFETWIGRHPDWVNIILELPNVVQGTTHWAIVDLIDTIRDKYFKKSEPSDSDYTIVAEEVFSVSNIRRVIKLKFQS